MLQANLRPKSLLNIIDTAAASTRKKMFNPKLSISIAWTLILLAVVPVQSRFPSKLQDQFGYLDTEEYYQWAVRIRNGSQAYRSYSPRDQPQARVVGGKDAPEGAAKFQISLLKNYIIVKSHMCGGSFLTPSTVVTAAHCTYGQSESSLIVRYGTQKRSSSSYPDMSVKQIVQHESYNPNTIENDISLLILAKPVTPSTNVDVIEIETEPQNNDAKVLVYGWGLTDGNSQTLPENLQVGEMSIVDNEKCNQKWGSVNAIADGMICALDKTQSACNGDSGGPLVSSNGRLTGIVSWGPSKCPPGEYMSVFTRPSYYAEWIKANQV